MAPPLFLPPVLDLRAASPLKAEIQQHIGSPLSIDASMVERIGGLCLQVLVAASKAWHGANLDFRVINASPAFEDDVRLMNAAELLDLNKGAPTC